MPASYPPVPYQTGFTFAKRHQKTYPEIDPVLQSSSTAGKAVVITGGSRGIGLATAKSYAAAGASHIAITARSASDLAKAKDEIESHCRSLGRSLPDVILPIPLDVTDAAAADAAAQQVRSSFGRLDILINNAGRIDVYTPIADSDPLAWWEQHRVNVLGAYLTTRAFLPLLLAGGDKTIVITASIGAHAVQHGGSGYGTGKLAALRLCEYVMTEYAGDGVLCFGVHPGGVATDMTQYMTQEFIDTLLTDEVSLPADALVWLTQTKRDWLAGRYVDLTWDMPELVSREEEIVKGDKLKVKLVV